MESDILNEENVLFNNTLNTFYLWLYGIGHILNEENVLFNNALNTFFNGYMESDILNEENVLFNNTLNTFYLWLYGIRHILNEETVFIYGYTDLLVVVILLEPLWSTAIPKGGVSLVCLSLFSISPLLRDM